MTTQLFWVPNHALGAWLGIGLLARRERGVREVDSLMPLLVAMVSLWSPLAAIGLVPFVLWRVGETTIRERSGRLFHPQVWLPALAVGLAIAAYLTLDSGRIPKGWTIGQEGTSAAALADDLWRQAEFFLLEAGLIGFAILWIRRSAAVALALGVLAVLPLMRFGGANDLVMRASIPALTVLAIGACLALAVGPSPAGFAAGTAPLPSPANLRIKKAVLIGLLSIGAVTPFQEFARAVALKPWPANPDATLIDTWCGTFPAHYVARLRGGPVAALLPPPHALPIGRAGPDACEFLAR